MADKSFALSYSLRPIYQSLVPKMTGRLASSVHLTVNYAGLPFACPPPPDSTVEFLPALKPALLQACVPAPQTPLTSTFTGIYTPPSNSICVQRSLVFLHPLREQGAIPADPPPFTGPLHWAPSLGPRVSPVCLLSTFHHFFTLPLSANLPIQAFF